LIFITSKTTYNTEKRTSSINEKDRKERERVRRRLTKWEGKKVDDKIRNTRYILNFKKLVWNSFMCSGSNEILINY